LGLNSRGCVGSPNLSINPNLIPLGSVHSRGVDNSNKGRDGCIDALNSDVVVSRPMELVLVEENIPIMLSDGKKRQRIVENSCVLLDANAGSGSMDVSASSAGQSSRAQ
ncbi:hypothetical protein Goari_027187, partial [Gossypium aridum]|nr:hypothetical protein [Gossypium aridum]